MDGYDICNFKLQYLCHDIIMSLYRIISGFHCEGGSCLVMFSHFIDRHHIFACLSKGHHFAIMSPFVW